MSKLSFLSCLFLVCFTYEVSYAALSNRLVGGQDAGTSQFPYFAEITHFTQPFAMYFIYCGGALIRENWVLTAAQCQREYQLTDQVRLGDANVGYQIHGIAQFVRHPAYIGMRGVISQADIALIQLSTNAILTNSIALISLPQDTDCNNLTNVIAMGWGSINGNTQIQPSTLQWAQMSPISIDNCTEALQNVPGSRRISSSMICTNGSNDGNRQTVCTYDSGGPLVTSTATPSVIGIISWPTSTAFEVCSGGRPSIYTRVCSYTSNFISRYLPDSQ